MYVKKKEGVNARIRAADHATQGRARPVPPLAPSSSARVGRLWYSFDVANPERSGHALLPVVSLFPAPSRDMCACCRATRGRAVRAVSQTRNRATAESSGML